MSILKKTTKLDLKMKGVVMTDEAGVLLDENGDYIDLWDSLKKAFGSKTFSLSASLSDNEEIDLDNYDPVDEENGEDEDY